MKETGIVSSPRKEGGANGEIYLVTRVESERGSSAPQEIKDPLEQAYRAPCATYVLGYRILSDGMEGREIRPTSMLGIWNKIHNQTETDHIPLFMMLSFRVHQ